MTEAERERNRKKRMNIRKFFREKIQRKNMKILKTIIIYDENITKQTRFSFVFQDSTNIMTFKTSTKRNTKFKIRKPTNRTYKVEHEHTLLSRIL